MDYPSEMQIRMDQIAAQLRASIQAQMEREWKAIDDFTHKAIMDHSSILGLRTMLDAKKVPAKGRMIWPEGIGGA